MRTFRAAASAIGLMFLVALPASAQGPRGGFMGGPAALLSNKSVQKELKLDEGQSEKIGKLAQDIREKQREAFSGLQDLSQEERRAKMGETMRTLNAEVDKSLAEVLKAEQLKRYHEIGHQIRGAGAFTDPKVAESLKLTEEQKSSIRTLLTDQQSAMREIFPTLQDDREAGMKKIQALQKETKEKALAVLTADQKKTWETMVGAPFEFVPEPPPPRNN